jgi:glucose dehydrogenase/mono/diheme cytochrome c family protein
LHPGDACGGTDEGGTIMTCDWMQIARLTLVTVGALCSFAASAQTPAARADGWYTAIQATEGRRLYGAKCASCHGAKLEGGAGPTLRGAGFQRKWGGRPLQNLYDVAHGQMPLAAPGSLKDDESLAVMAYLLQQNGFAPGAAALAMSGLDRKVATPKSAPQAAAAGAPQPPTVPVTQPSSNVVTQAELDAADTDPKTWLTYNKGYKGYRYSTAAQINAANAAQLRPLCVLQLGEVGTFQTGPVVHDGAMYVTTSHNVYALDATTCEQRWEYRYSLWGPEVQVNNKGVAIADGRLIRGTTDGSLIALDAKTGKLLWLRKIMDVTAGEFAVAAPLVWKGMVFIGKAGADWGIQGEMMAFRANDGAKVWGFSLIPRPGETGFDTWKIPASAKLGGGSTWSSYSLDAEAGLLLVPVGNAAPDYNSGSRPGNNLFTNSIVALDGETGKLRWWHQLKAPDDKDLDTTVVSAFDTPGGERLVAAAGKDGVLHVVDRRDGRLRYKIPIATQLNLDVPLTAAGVRFCPQAAVLNNGPAYSPATNLIYINSQDWCGTGFAAAPKYVRGLQYGGGHSRRDPVEAATGFTTAIDASTGVVKWRYASPKGVPMLSAIAASAGNVIFTGDTAGYFLAMNASTGEVLYRFQTGGVLGGGVATYEVGGKQYVAVASGNTSFHPYKAAGAPTILIFGL